MQLFKENLIFINSHIIFSKKKIFLKFFCFYKLFHHISIYLSPNIIILVIIKKAMFQEFNKPQSLLISLFLYVALLPFAYLITLRFIELSFPIEYCYGILFFDWFLTSLIFIISVIIGNCSLIDFYWTIIPILEIYYSLTQKFQMQSFNLFLSPKLLLTVIIVNMWGMRLTYNYIRSWIGFKYVDFRIGELLEKLPKIPVLVWFVLYFEYFIFPGLFLYFAKVTVLSFVLYCDPYKFTIFNGVGLFMMISAVIYQTIADKQLFYHRLCKNNKKILDTGLWYYSRHPNYFGEMMFWWGAFFLSFELYFDLSEGLWFLTGPMGMTILFHFMTGPWMDSHLIRKRPEYREYIKKNRSSVIPWFRKEENSKMKD